MAYATTADLERRWRLLTPDETAQAAQLLEDAATVLDTYVHGAADAAILSIVSCNMVRRAMSPDAFAPDQPSYGTQSWSPYTAAGELLPDWKELKMLRSGSRVGYAEMAAD